MAQKLPSQRAMGEFPRFRRGETTSGGHASKMAKGSKANVMKPWQKDPAKKAMIEKKQALLKKALKKNPPKPKGPTVIPT